MFGQLLSQFLCLDCIALSFGIDEVDCVTVYSELYSFHTHLVQVRVSAALMHLMVHFLLSNVSVNCICR